MNLTSRSATDPVLTWPRNLTWNRCLKRNRRK
jgi:hypothetical protein